jgi:hypothetical protein
MLFSVTSHRVSNGTVVLQVQNKYQVQFCQGTWLDRYHAGTRDRLIYHVISKPTRAIYSIQWYNVLHEKGTTPCAYRIQNP